MADTDSELIRWVQLRDARTGSAPLLRVAAIEGVHYLMITGLPTNAPAWKRAQEVLKFAPARDNRFLVYRVSDATPAHKLSDYRKVWPDSAVVSMERSRVLLSLKTRAPSAADADARAAEIDLTLFVRLGRNAQGDEVLEGSAGRALRPAGGGPVVLEDKPGTGGAAYLRAANQADLALCADGVVRSVEMGEVQYAEDFDRLLVAIGGEVDREQLHSAIDAALMHHLRTKHALASDAYGDAARLYDLLAPYSGSARGAAAMPAPLSVIAQRLLGDTSDKRVLVPNAFDGACFAFLPPKSQIRAYRGSRDLQSAARLTAHESLHWGGETVDLRQEMDADALFYNADPAVNGRGERTDYLQAMRQLRCLREGARAVLVLAGDSPEAPGQITAASSGFYNSLATNFQVEEAFEVALPLTRRAGGGRTLRCVALRNARPQAMPGAALGGFPQRIAVCQTWDEIKERVDEALARAHVREQAADDESLDPALAGRRSAHDAAAQKPYLAFSKIGEARTMVPSNLQGPIQAALTNLEQSAGCSVDELVSEALGFGMETLAERLSPEQIDAIALSVAQMQRGRSNILEDETGIGKGRTLASLAVWANKQGKNVVFLTNSANLFSDFFGGDLGDIEERGRFRPFILNANEPVLDKNAQVEEGRPLPVLAPAQSLQRIRQVVGGNVPLEQTGCNMILATYSQINTEDSEKATWLKNQLSNALLIVDESHVAAGSDSNVAMQVAEMVQLAWAVQYSSATWAKSAQNLNIYSRAFPEAINVDSLAHAMKTGGEAFAEIFSSMLAHDGALTRREHDMSRIERTIVVDEQRLDANIKIADAAAVVLNAVALVSGDIGRAMARLNESTVQALRQAYEAREQLRHQATREEAQAMGIGAVAAARLLSASFGAGSMLYNVNRRMLAALGAPNVVDICRESLANGQRPIVIFDDTGERLMEEVLQEQIGAAPAGAGDDSFARQPTLKDLLRQVARRLTRVRVRLLSNAEANEVGEAASEREARRRAGVIDVDAQEPADGAAEADQDHPQAPQVGVDMAAAEAGGPMAPTPEDGIADLADIVGTAGQEAEEPPEEGVPARRQRRSVARPRYVYRSVLDPEYVGASEDTREALRKGLEEVDRLIEALPDVPLNAVDVIHQALRAEGFRTSEISGRKAMLVALPDGRFALERRDKSKKAVTQTVRDYQNGLSDVIIINRSAATGIGLHAQPRFADPRQRNMIWAQPPENPTDVTQLAGRGNRYDQLSAPRMTFPATGLYGELRQIMMNNKKQVMLSCNVRSSRLASMRFQDVPDLLNVVGSQAVSEVLRENPGYAHRMGIDMKLLEERTESFNFVSLLNRVPMLAHREQEAIYTDIYAAFDEILLRKELSGTNPLKPHELDVRAQVQRAGLFFGVETGGVGSAFFGPVYHNTIEWSEQVTPQPWSSVIDRVEAARAAMISDGQAVAAAGEDATHYWATPIDTKALAEKVARQFEALARIALSAAGLRHSLNEVEDLPVHQLGSTHPVRRALQRARWARRHLARVVPGTVLRDQVGIDVRYSVIVGVEVPPSGKEYQFNRWRVRILSPGQSKERAMPMSALIDGANVERVVQAQSDADDDHREVEAVDVYFASHINPFGQTSEQAQHDPAVTRLVKAFDDAPGGMRQRSAVVLTGNMYLASDWAAGTKAGRGTLFTDDRGVRHRGVLVDAHMQDAANTALLPARVSMPGALARLVDALLDPTVVEAEDQELGRQIGGGSGSMRHVSGYSDFVKAWRAIETPDITIRCARAPGPDGDIGASIALRLSESGLRRLIAQLRGAQDKIRKQVYGEKRRAKDDPDHVQIKSTSAGRGGAGSSVELCAKSANGFRRAVRMLTSSIGMTLNLPRGGPRGGLSTLGEQSWASRLGDWATNSYLRQLALRSKEEARGAQSAVASAADLHARGAPATASAAQTPETPGVSTVPEGAAAETSTPAAYHTMRMAA